MSTKTNQSFGGDILQHRYPRRALLRGGLGAAAVAGLTTISCGGGGQKQSSSTTTTPTGTPFKLANSWTGVGQEGALYAAIDQGIFKKNGLDISLTQLAGTNAIAALLGGSIQVADAGGGEALASAVAGTDVVVVIIQTPVYTGKLYVTPDIKSPSDLKGKKVGIALPGGTSDQTLRTALTKLGLQPDKDVTFVSTGSIANQSAALLSGAIQGTNVNPGPASIQLDAAGMKPLLDFAGMGLPGAATVGMSMRRSFIAAHHDVAQRYVDSIIEGTVVFRRNRTLGLRLIGTILKTDDQAGIAAYYDYVNSDTIMPLAPVPKAELFKPLQDTLCNSRKIEAACNFDLNKAVDPSLVESAVKRGLNK